MVLVDRDQYRMCFGCGPDNPHGLRLKVVRQDDGAWQAEFVPRDFHCGWPGVVHGGVLATALDEVMNYIVFGQGQTAVTARMVLEFKSLASPGDRLIVRALPTRVTRRVVDTKSEITKADGTVVCRAEARFLVLTADQRKAMGLGGTPGSRVE